MKTILVILLCFPTLSVATTRDDRLWLRHREPVAEFETGKSVDEFIGCVNPKLVSIHPSVQQIDDGNSRVLRVTNLANTQVIVRVSPADSGARVDYRTRFNSGIRKFTEAVMSCR